MLTPIQSLTYIDDPNATRAFLSVVANLVALELGKAVGSTVYSLLRSLPLLLFTRFCLVVLPQATSRNGSSAE